MNVLITGANGFVGQALCQRLLDTGLNGRPVTTVTALDVRFDAPARDLRVRQIEGSIADAALLDRAFEMPVDFLFHLASIPGGAAEKNFELGLEVNLHATIALLERGRLQASAPVLVFASTIAVYGASLPALVDDSTPMRPHLSYGAHKLAGEVLVQDYSRRGFVDGRILRLPGIVARPPGPSGLLSAFMSDIFWQLKAGKPFACPVSAQAVAWWMSVSCCIDNFVIAASLTSAQVAERRDYTLPVLRLTIAELVEAMAALYGDDRRALIAYHPNEQLEAGFGRLPPLEASAAQRVGLHHDGSIEQLIHNATAYAGIPH